MLLKNTGRYPTHEVRKLLAVAARGLDLERVAVHVVDSHRAYDDRPCIAKMVRVPIGADHLVTLRIGAPGQFPADNMRTVMTWGKGSPLIVMMDWREGLVALAAHKFNHIRQFHNNWPRSWSEVQCEKFAAKRLAAYRESSLRTARNGRLAPWAPRSM